MIQEELSKELSGKCQFRWKERGYNNVCGNPMPCSKHTDMKKWREDKVKAITKLFLESLPEKKESEGFTAEEIGFNQAINQITQRWGE